MDEPRPIPLLKLSAFDADDLAVLSAHLQDAVLKVGDLHWLARRQRFVLVVSRFDWAGAGAGPPERRLAGVVFSRVLKVAARNIRSDAPDAVLALLAATFTPGVEPPAGTVELTFSGGGSLRLEVECLEAALADLGPHWTARRRPAHEPAGS